MSLDRSSSLTELARQGFGRIEAAEKALAELEAATGLDRGVVLAGVDGAGDPDGALDALVRIARRDASRLAVALADPVRAPVLWALLGASRGFADFYVRHPDELAHVPAGDGGLPTASELRDEFHDAVGVQDGFASSGDESAWVALRVRYRRMLARIAAADLLSPDPVAIVGEVAAALADAAGAVLDASLAVARTRISAGSAGGLFPREQVAATDWPSSGWARPVHVSSTT